MNLRVKPASSLTPYILAVYDADMPEDTARVCARHDVRNGQTWRTKNSAVKTTMREINAALAAVKS